MTKKNNNIYSETAALSYAADKEQATGQTLAKRRGNSVAK